MDKDLKQAKLIANSYDGGNITTEDIVTACMGMARWKDEHAAVVSEIKNPSGLIVKTFRNELESIKPTEYIPCFWVNKATWTEGYKKQIIQAVTSSNYGITLVIDGVLNGKSHIYTTVFSCISDFKDNYELIERCLDGNIQTIERRSCVMAPYDIIDAYNDREASADITE